MIDDQTKQKLLDELEKTGNVWSSCAKLNIHRSTVYRWRENDKSFTRAMDKAVRIGRENMNDFTEHALMTNVKKCNQRAIEYQLAHRHPAYRTRPPSNVVILHKKEYAQVTKGYKKTLEDLLDDDERVLNLKPRTAEEDIDQFFSQGKYTKDGSGEPRASAPDKAGGHDDSRGDKGNHEIKPLAKDERSAEDGEAD